MMLAATILALAAQSTFTVTNAAYDGPVRPSHNARLVWQDDFESNRLNLDKWSFDTVRNKQGWHNGELQYYSAGRRQNTRVANGMLTIEARHEIAKFRGGLGRPALHLSQDRLERRGLDLRLL